MELGVFQWCFSELAACLDSNHDIFGGPIDTKVYLFNESNFLVKASRLHFGFRFALKYSSKTLKWQSYYTIRKNYNLFYLKFTILLWVIISSIRPSERKCFIRFKGGIFSNNLCNWKFGWCCTNWAGPLACLFLLYIFCIRLDFYLSFFLVYLLKGIILSCLRYQFFYNHIYKLRKIYQIN